MRLERIGGELAACEKEPRTSDGDVAKQESDVSELRKKFTIMQRKAWVEKRLAGNPWLITDLLTFGSPMTHAHSLLASDRNSLRRKQYAFELCRCPPEREPFDVNKWNGDTWYSWENTKGHRVLYHAAPFALVKWTNFWFATDLFGGRLAPNFGYGITDYKLEAGSWRTRLPLWSHTQYFKYDTKKPTLPFVKTIRDTLELNGESKLSGESWSWLSATLGSPQPDLETLKDTGKM